MVNLLDIIDEDEIYLYGDTLRPFSCNVKPFIGLSNLVDNNENLYHDFENKLPFLDNTVDIYQSEEIFHKKDINTLLNVINDIYRVLKPGGLFRLSIPDYRCDILNERSYKNENNEIFYDPGGGGNYDYLEEKVIDGGTIWFPKYEKVLELLQESNFDNNNINFLHYYNSNDEPILNEVNYRNGYISRTPDNDERVKSPARPLSMIIDLYK